MLPLSAWTLGTCVLQHWTLDSRHCSLQPRHWHLTRLEPGHWTLGKYSTRSYITRSYIMLALESGHYSQDTGDLCLTSLFLALLTGQPGQEARFLVRAEPYVWLCFVWLKLKCTACPQEALSYWAPKTYITQVLYLCKSEWHKTV